MPTITQLPAAGALNGSEAIPTVQNGVTVQTTPSAMVRPYLVPLYHAASYEYGGTWDAAHDVGPAINAAIADAAAAGGGTILLPCGTYGLATPIVNQTSGVNLVGGGVGIPRDNQGSANFKAVTKLLWIGAYSAGQVGLTWQTPTGGATLYNAGVWGVTVDGASNLDTGILVNGVTHSWWYVGGAECRVTNIRWLQPDDQESLGNQENEVWLYSRSTSSTYTPTGIRIDSGTVAPFNTSYNHFHMLYAWYHNGDGIVFGNSDNNLVDTIRTRANSQGVSTGSPVVFANANYVMPNGITVNGTARQVRILHGGGNGYWVQGLQYGAAWGVVAGNSGTAVETPIIIPTTATAVSGANQLTFTATAGVGAANAQNVVAGMALSCGSPASYASGVFPGSPISAVGATTVTLPTTLPYDQNSGTSCKFGAGVTSSAAKGTYNIGYFTGTNTVLAGYTCVAAGWCIAAPAGGHSQNGLALSGGNLVGTDLVAPIVGAPTNNDKWTLTLTANKPPWGIVIEGIDSGNGTPNPTYEKGSSGMYWSFTTPTPTSVP